MAARCPAVGDSDATFVAQCCNTCIPEHSNTSVCCKTDLLHSSTPGATSISTSLNAHVLLRVQRLQLTNPVHTSNINNHHHLSLTVCTSSPQWPAPLAPRAPPPPGRYSRAATPASKW